MPATIKTKKVHCFSNKSVYLLKHSKVGTSVLTQLSPHRQLPAAGMIAPDHPGDIPFTQSTRGSGICSSVAPTMLLIWIVCISSSIENTICLEALGAKQC